IDLVQAEAVMDLIGSRTEKSSKIALSQLEGNLSVQVNRLRQSLVDILAEIEVNLDYPEYDFEQITAQNCSIRLFEIKKELIKLMSSFSFGKILREGMEAAIIGKPNAGKSSLLNRLARKNRAIVTEIPGTTRDILEEYVNILGLPIKLIDTAGLRQTEDRVEKIGVKKAWEVIDSADLILFILDAYSGFEKEDDDIYEKVKDYHDKTLYVVNKTDITSPGKIHEIKAKIRDFLEISVLEDSGINALESEIYHFVNKNEMDTDNQVLVTNSRHKMLLTDAEKGIETALSAIDANMTLDIISMDIKSAADSLGQITGHHVSEEIVLNIFQRFCVGK
ncbi:MAG: tRNA uridine-5-carboxymethylaminomethyl(34) synthesis GTPase MnmE, partial [Deltaproteobacteria bacterium]|nr:tRNA uridine-5-carboxymethylaminomethyl(34) synthesis GTPase MnmE [Deltaproteobacteria bacterium]